MQVHDLKIRKRKIRKTVGRGGKKGTYSGRGVKGQKARSGASVNPLFEGGRSTLIDHMKKKRGFKSGKPEKNEVQLSAIEKKFQDGDIINGETLVQKGLVKKVLLRNGIKIIGGNEAFTKKVTVEKGILLSATSKKSIEKAGGKIAS
jgi:large subunit ribosomal protein L15